MKRILTAAFALSLMAGVSAYAQDQSAPPAASSSTDQGATPAAGAMPPDQSGAAPAGAMPSDQSGAAPAQGSMAMPDQSGAAPATVANAPAGAPPSSYPVCTHKGEDRCQQRGGAHEESTTKTTHHAKHMAKKTHHMKAKTTDATPAAAPAAPAQ